MDRVRDPGSATQGAATGLWEAWICHSDPSLASELAELLAEQAPEARVTLLPNPAVLESRLDRPSGRLPAACFLEVPTRPEERLGLLARLTGPAFRISTVVLLAQQNHELALRCLRVGACGCLTAPLDADQLLPVLPRLGCAASGTASESSRGRVISVLPARGSSGATTLAANFACHAARGGDRRVLVADMDLLAGTLGFMFKLTSPHSFADALSHAGALDADLWKGLVAPYRGLDVLLSPEDPVECDLQVAGLSSLIGYARRAYDLVVLDTGGAFCPLGADLARLSDEILLVTTGDVGVVHGATRTLAYLNAQGCPDDRIRIVGSRWRRGAGLDRDGVESVLGHRLCSVLPSDPQATEDALLEGRPVAPGSALGRAVAELASQILESDAGPARPSASRRWLSLFSRGG